MRPRFDRAAIMRDAWKRFRDGQRLGLGWSFGHCLATAWAAAKMRRVWQTQSCLDDGAAPMQPCLQVLFEVSPLRLIDQCSTRRDAERFLNHGGTNVSAE